MLVKRPIIDKNFFSGVFQVIDEYFFTQLCIFCTKVTNYSSIHFFRRKTEIFGHRYHFKVMFFTCPNQLHDAIKKNSCIEWTKTSMILKTPEKNEWEYSYLLLPSHIRREIFICIVAISKRCSNELTLYKLPLGLQSANSNYVLITFLSKSSTFLGKSSRKTVVKRFQSN